MTGSRGQARASDVVVLGGGIVGTATAAFLASAGLRVTLVEQAEIAAGASGRNSGVVQHPFDPVLVGLYRRSVDLYRDLESALPDVFRLGGEPAGLMLVGPYPAAGIAVGLVEAWTRTHPEARAELVAGAGLRDLEPALADDLVACRLDVGYPVAPGSATRAYARLAERLGARLVAGQAASLAVEGEAVVGVSIGGRLLPAGAVVVAAGPWTPSVVGLVTADGRAWPPIARSWGVVAELRLERPPRHALEEIEIDIEPADRPGSDPGDGGERATSSADAGLGFSLVTADGASALGSTFLPAPPSEPEMVARLRERGARYVPEVATAPLVSSRSCARPVSPDGRPLLGAIPGLRGGYIAAGHGPWGISTGPGSARLVADLVLGRVDGIPAALAPSRFGSPGPAAGSAGARSR